MSEPTKLTVEGTVILDGDCVYVNGMRLSGLLRAMFPTKAGTQDSRGQQLLGTLRIEVADEEPA